MKHYSDKAKMAMVELASYRFIPIKYTSENDHFESVISAIDKNSILSEAEVYFWNKQGESLEFKFLTITTPDEEQNLIKEIEKTLSVELIDKTAGFEVERIKPISW